MQCGTNRLVVRISFTAEHVFQIVTDPKFADAVFTDQIGEGFQTKLEELYPSPEPVEKPAPKPKPEDEESASPLLGDTVNQPPNDGSSRKMDRTAREIVSRFEKELKKK